jgi:hypothetical protein
MTGNLWRRRTLRQRRPHFRGCRPAVELLEPRLTPTILPSGFTETNVVSGLSGPTAMDFAPDAWITS